MPLLSESERNAELLFISACQGRHSLEYFRTMAETLDETGLEYLRWLASRPGDRMTVEMAPLSLYSLTFPLPGWRDGTFTGECPAPKWWPR